MHRFRLLIYLAVICFYTKILRVSWTAKKTNEWVFNKAGVKRELLDTVKARKLPYYGHINMWTELPWKSQSELQRTEINGERTSMVWPTLGSRMAKEQNRTSSSETCFRTAAFDILSTHADRQDVDISFTVCEFFVRLCVWLWISPPRIKLAASNFARRFVGVQSRESSIFVNFAAQKAKICKHVGHAYRCIYCVK